MYCVNPNVDILVTDTRCNKIPIFLFIKILGDRKLTTSDWLFNKDKLCLDYYSNINKPYVKRR
jgi:hypothetical protein